MTTLYPELENPEPEAREDLELEACEYKKEAGDCLSSLVQKESYESDNSKIDDPGLSSIDTVEEGINFDITTGLEPYLYTEVTDKKGNEKTVYVGSKIRKHLIGLYKLCQTGQGWDDNMGHYLWAVEALGDENPAKAASILYKHVLDYSGMQDHHKNSLFSKFSELRDTPLRYIKRALGLLSQRKDIIDAPGYNPKKSNDDTLDYSIELVSSIKRHFDSDLDLIQARNRHEKEAYELILQARELTAQVYSAKDYMKAIALHL
ncbi:hypothetical protein JXB31_01180 [Candidatus Woesearchaeota archaeon]|nr:hypothetical protein [Candidatus Woesearchaeota archaeon]